MIILGFDTSGKTASACIIKDNTVISTVTGDMHKKHAETIIPMIHECFSKTDMTLSDMDYIATDIGPGSFTGVRIGVSVANSFSYVNKIPVIGVNSLYALAESASVSVPICSLIDARNQTAYSYCRDSSFNEILKVDVYSISDISLLCPENTLYIGNVPELCKNLIEPNAEMICQYALKHLDLSSSYIKPNYYRPSQAERVKYGY